MEWRTFLKQKIVERYGFDREGSQSFANIRDQACTIHEYEAITMQMIICEEYRFGLYMIDRCLTTERIKTNVDKWMCT